MKNPLQKLREWWHGVACYRSFTIRFRDGLTVRALTLDQARDFTAGLLAGDAEIHFDPHANRDFGPRYKQPDQYNH